MSEPNQENENPPFYKEWAFWFVAIYLLFIVIYTGFFICSDGENFMLSSNELGDFLAGTFAPLAFLFLYLGYKQQGVELKQNTKALIMQAEELRISNDTLKQQVDEMQKSVQAQQNMFSLAEKQFESVLQEKAYLAYPRLSLSGSDLRKNLNNSSITNYFLLEFRNLNVPIKNITIISPVWNILKNTYETRHILNISDMSSSEVTQVKFYTLPNQSDAIFSNEIIKIEFSDLENNKYCFSYNLEDNDPFVIFKKIE
ncbi:hypothetical protein M2R48_05345 [Acinetobacter sp. I-MWF]|uniref:hypothetical protein n=1 Tax=Acinetobacter sp. I-MWF TaxID=2940517 RepID=UPI0021C9494C|nr:hypothetical protein [Acinetobacter sp. I-MWF]MCT9977748.1 hypothetical protein [Acinetobacter sp. I-MWF]